MDCRRRSYSFTVNRGSDPSHAAHNNNAVLSISCEVLPWVPTHQPPIVAPLAQRGTRCKKKLLSQLGAQQVGTASHRHHDSCTLLHAADARANRYLPLSDIFRNLQSRRLRVVKRPIVVVWLISQVPSVKPLWGPSAHYWKR